MSTSRTCLLVLGSNIEPEKNLERAIAALLESFGRVHRSSIYISAAVGAPGTPDFHNQAVVIETDLDSATLRDRLRAIETALGRVRTEDRNAPRTIDIDRMALFDPAGCALPEPPVDPELLLFAHLLIPAAEVLPHARLRDGGLTLAEHAANFRKIPEHFERCAVDGPSVLQRDGSR